MSDIQPKTVVVGDRSYIITKFYADTGLKVFLRMAKFIAEPIAQGAGLTGMDQNSDAFIQGAALLFSTLATRLDERDVLLTVEDLLSVVIPQGQTYALADPLNPTRSTWKIHFQGRLSELGLVLIESVKENFEDFLFVLKLVKGKLASVPQSAPGSKPQST